MDGWIQGYFPPFLYHFSVLPSVLHRTCFTLKTKHQNPQMSKTPELQRGPVLAYLGLSHPPGCRRPPFLTTATQILAVEVSLVFSKRGVCLWQKGRLTSSGNEWMKRIVREKDSEEETHGAGRGGLGGRWETGQAVSFSLLRPRHKKLGSKTLVFMFRIKADNQVP